MAEWMATLMNNQNRVNNNRQHHRASVDGSFGEEEDEYEEKVPCKCHRGAVEEDRQCWETKMRTKIPEFHGNLQLEEFLDWLAIVEEILEFKGVPANKHMPLVAMRLRGRPTAWWQQLKFTHTRLAKEKIST